MEMVRWAFAALGALVLMTAPTEGAAQTVTVQGEVRYQQPYGQQTYGQPHPQSYGQPPPGYGQQPPVYGQPYAQPYVPQTRQVRHVERETSVKGLWIPGIIIFGASWALTATTASAFTAGDYALFAWIPLVGPWLMLGAAGNDEQVGAALASGILQLAGATMFILGLTLRQTVRVAEYSFDERDARAPQLAFELLPAPAGAMVGLTLSHF